MSLTKILLLLIPTVGQVEAESRPYIPGPDDYVASIGRQDGEYRVAFQGKKGQAVSRDLVRWSEVKGPLRPVPIGDPEIQLPLDGNRGKMRWLTFGPCWTYSLGKLDDDSASASLSCPPAISPLQVGGRSIQILRPGLIFVPHELGLISTPDGPRLTHLPVRELDVLHGKAIIGKRSLAAGATNPLAELRGRRFDVQTNFRPGKSKVTFRIRGIDVVYEVASETITVDGKELENHDRPKSIKLPLVATEVELRIVTSDGVIEVFANGGLQYSNAFLKWDDSDTIAVKVTGDPVLFRWLDVFELRSPDVLGKGPAADITKETFGVTPFPESTEKNGFVTAGKNATESLAKLTAIRGQSIKGLEYFMRPGSMARAGFLGEKEKLLDVLVEDNRTVVDKLGKTHAELAVPLRILGAYAQEKGTKEPIEFVYRGRRFQARAEVAKAYIDSPFNDQLATNVSVTLWNLDNGKSLTYSMMVPHLIERYGFYEGHGTSYRVEPSDIVDVLELRR
jgi:hypothetical protein